jgi:hypothetical protein
MRATILSLVNMDPMPMEDTPKSYQTPPLAEENVPLQNTLKSWEEQKYSTLNQDRLCWRGPEAFTLTGPYRITVQRIWCLLRKTNLSSYRKGGPIYNHINGLGTSKTLFMTPNWARKQERLCWRGPAAIYCYTVLCFQKLGGIQPQRQQDDLIRGNTNRMMIYFLKGGN